MKLLVCLQLGLTLLANEVYVYGCAVPNHINTNSPKTLATQKLANALECLCKTIALVPVEMAGNINYPLNGYKRSQLTDTIPFVNDPANCQNRCYLDAHCPYRSSLYTMMYAYNNITGIIKTVHDTQLIDRNYGGPHDLNIRCNPIDQQWYTNGTRVDMIGCSILFDG